MSGTVISAANKFTSVAPKLKVIVGPLSKAAPVVMTGSKFIPYLNLLSWAATGVSIGFSIHDYFATKKIQEDLDYLNKLLENTPKPSPTIKPTAHYKSSNLQGKYPLNIINNNIFNQNFIIPERRLPYVTTPFGSNPVKTNDAKIPIATALNNKIFGNLIYDTVYSQDIVVNKNNWQDTTVNEVKTQELKTDFLRFLIGDPDVPLKNIGATISTDFDKTEIKYGLETNYQQAKVFKEASMNAYFDTNGHFVQSITKQEVDPAKTKDFSLQSEPSKIVKPMPMGSHTNVLNQIFNNPTPLQEVDQAKLLEFLGDVQFTEGGAARYEEYLKVANDPVKLNEFLKNQTINKPETSNILDIDNPTTPVKYEKQIVNPPDFVQQQLLNQGAQQYKLGLNDYPLNLPASLLNIDLPNLDPANFALPSLSSQLTWQAQQTDALMGEFPIKINQENPDGTTTPFDIPNVAEGLATALGLGTVAVALGKNNLSLNQNIGKDLLQTKNASLQSLDFGKANAEFLGYRGNVRPRVVQNHVSPTAMSKGNFDGPNPDDPDDNYNGWENEQMETVLEYLQKIMFAAQIIKQTHFKPQKDIEKETKKLNKIIDQQKKDILKKSEEWKQTIAEDNNLIIRSVDDKGDVKIFKNKNTDLPPSFNQPDSTKDILNLKKLKNINESSEDFKISNADPSINKKKS